MNNLVNKITKKSLFFKTSKRWEYHHIHLTTHKLIGKVRILGPVDGSFKVTEPDGDEKKWSDYDLEQYRECRGYTKSRNRH